MALDKAGLKASILALTENLFTDTGRTPAEAREKYAEDLANAIDAFVKTGTPVVPGTGLTAGSNAVNGTSNTGSIQ